jgi:hypothetical protein
MLLRRGRRANHAPKVSKSEVFECFRGEKWRFWTFLRAKMAFFRGRNGVFDPKNGVFGCFMGKDGVFGRFCGDN